MSVKNNGQLDAATLAEYHAEIAKDIENEGLERVVADAILGVFALEALTRQLQCMVNTTTSLLIEKNVFTAVEYNTKLSETLEEVSVQLEEIMRDLNEKKDRPDPTK